MSILPYGIADNSFYIELVIDKIIEYQNDIEDGNKELKILEDKQKKYISYIKNPDKLFEHKHEKIMNLLEEKISQENKYLNKESDVNILEDIIDLNLHRSFLVPIIFDGSFKSKRKKFLKNTEKFAKIELNGIETKINNIEIKINKYDIFRNKDEFNQKIDFYVDYYENKFLKNKKNIEHKNDILGILNKELSIFKHIKLNLLHINDYSNLFKIINEFFPNLKCNELDFFDLFFYFNLFYYLKINLYHRYDTIFKFLDQKFNDDIINLIFNNLREPYINCNVFKIDKDSNENRKIIFDYDLMFKNYEYDFDNLEFKIDDLISSYFSNSSDNIKNRVKELIIFIIWINHFLCPFYNPKTILLDIKGKQNYFDFIKKVENIEIINIFNTDINENEILNLVGIGNDKVNDDDENNDNKNNKLFNYGLDISNDLICFFEYDIN